MAISTVQGEAVAVEDKNFVLDAKKRCDRCGAQAYLRVFLESGDLLFCGHHYNKYEPKLLELMVKPTSDWRERLKENRKQGSEKS